MILRDPHFQTKVPVWSGACDLLVSLESSIELVQDLCFSPFFPLRQGPVSVCDRQEGTTEDLMRSGRGEER